MKRRTSDGLIVVGALALFVVGCDSPRASTFNARAGTGGTGGGSSVAPDSGSSGSSGARVDGGDGCGSTTLPTPCNTLAGPACTLSVDGTTREFFVELPTDYSATTAYPLVFAWHWQGDRATNLLRTGSSQGRFYGVRPEFPNAIYVAPQGLDSGTSDSGPDYGWPNTNGQDVDFTKAMLSWLQASYCIDRSRIFSTGMSYGGTMSNTLGCQMPDVFRALGVMSGDLMYSPQDCPDHPIAAWFTHGDMDTAVPIAADRIARDLFIAHNGCSATNTTTVALTDASAVTDAGAPVTTVCTIYTECTAGNYPVVFCPVPGGGHTVPSWAGAEIAKFFQQL